MTKQYELARLLLKHNIIGVTIDSRHVKVGDLFVAIKGLNVDGNLFIEQALKAGAALIITENTEVKGENIIHVDDARLALSQAAAIIYPKTPKYTIAVTGTNGKTSVVSYVRQLFELLGKDAVSIGSLGLEYYGSSQLNVDLSNYSLNTADLSVARRMLHQLALNHIDYAAFEASSHGLDQKRIYDIPIYAAAFTSFSQDHLDYHLTMDNYLHSKLKLFTENLLPTGYAVISSDMDDFDYIDKYLTDKNINIITVGRIGDVQITETKLSIKGQIVDFVYHDQKYQFNTKILGSFQASNLLIAAILVHKAGFAFECVAAKLSLLQAAQGRLQKVSKFGNRHIFVDYAHTPDALANSLSELRKLIVDNAKLAVLFGCGGNRDRIKRVTMGKIAQELADMVIITDDNPRKEEASMIRAEILQGTTNAIEIAGREQAIFYAIENMQENDILLIAGKGHEKYQIVGENVIAMDDVEIASRALQK